MTLLCYYLYYFINCGCTNLPLYVYLASCDNNISLLQPHLLLDKLQTYNVPPHFKSSWFNASSAKEGS